jgi:hypothetical protein
MPASRGSTARGTLVPSAVLFAIDDDAGPCTRCGTTCPAGSARNSEVAFELFSVVGLDDRAGHELRELLTCFNVPFRIVDSDSDPGRHRPGRPPRCTPRRRDYERWSWKRLFPAGRPEAAR